MTPARGNLSSEPITNNCSACFGNNKKLNAIRRNKREHSRTLLNFNNYHYYHHLISLTIVLISLFVSVSLAANSQQNAFERQEAAPSSSIWDHHRRLQPQQPQQPQHHRQHQSRNLDDKYERRALAQVSEPAAAWPMRRARSSLPAIQLDRSNAFESTRANNQQQQQQPVERHQDDSDSNSDDDSDDARFLQRLEVAAEFLDKKLAERESEQQQRSILEHAKKFGSKSRMPETYQVNDEQGPAYSFGSDAADSVADEETAELNGNGGGGGGGEPEQRLLEQIGLSIYDKPQQRMTDDLDKLFMKSLLLDKAHAQTVEHSTKTTKQQVDTEQTSAPPKLTTLLEDEDKNVEVNGEKSAPKRNDDGDGDNSSSETTTATYGKLVYESAADSQGARNSTRDKGQAADESAPVASNSGVLGRVYSKLAQYLPFINQLSLLRGQNVDNSQQQKKASTLAGHRQEDKIEPSRPLLIAVGKDEEKQTATTTTTGDAADVVVVNGELEPHAKQSVSVSMVHNNNNNNDDNSQKQQTAEDKVKSVKQQDETRVDRNDKQTSDEMKIKKKVKISVIKKDNDDDDDDDNNGDQNANDQDKLNVNNEIQLEESQLVAPKRVVTIKASNPKRLSKPKIINGALLLPSESEFSDENRDNLDVDMSQMLPVLVASHNNQFDDNNQQQQQHFGYQNLLRQSSLVLPQTTQAGGLNHLASEPSESLTGKYIYAPAQHYYLSSLVDPIHHNQQQHRHHQQQQQQPLMSHSSGGTTEQGNKRLQLMGTADEIYGSAYEPAAARAYAFQKDPSIISSGTGNIIRDRSTNDLYFLVMVGAFCVMAMAVVLAAGMFAYRVQQTRKMSAQVSEGYPTYGVVGPNNMLNGKCGAAAFSMGNYFVGGGGGGSGNAGHGTSPSAGSSKSGSTKHLPADALAYTANNNSKSHKTSAAGSDSGINSIQDKLCSLAGGGGGGSVANHNKKASSSASSLNENTHHSSSTTASQRTTPGAGFMGGAASQDAARMYHYQHQKQQMIISDRSASGVGARHASASDLDSDDENDDGSYTVYECPGLASAHEMEIKNPLFNDDQSP